MRIADGVPVMLGGVEGKPFPANGENVFTLENAPGHPVYGNNPESYRQMMQSEEEELEAIQKKWRSRN
jgi:hypothetical protein